ncbi:MAG: helix-turn-helix domain-containing protein [Pseudonocardiaceae bacterium]
MGQRPRELTPYVSLRHFFGAELRQWREVAGLSHDRLGARINYSGDLIGKVEKAERAPTAALATACDEVLGTGGALVRLFGLIEAVDQEELATRAAAINAPEQPVCGWLLAGQALTVGESPAKGADPVNRFEFLTSTFGAGVGSLLGSAESGDVSRLGQDDVVRWRRNLSQLYELDHQYGSAGVYDLALRSLKKLRRVMHRASYGPSTGEELHTVLGELSMQAGWLAFDAGRQGEARYWWLEASHIARLVDDDRLFANALRFLSRQATELGLPREGIDLVQAAQQAVKPWGTPCLRSDLLSLEALAHSRAGDKSATWHALHQADALLGSGPHDDDPSWVSSWGDEAGLACLEMRAALSLRELPLAERCSRTALAAVRPEYPRSRVLYMAYRAEVLVEQRSIEEAVATAAQAVEGAIDVSSARIDTRIGRVRAELARYSDRPRVAEFLDWSGQVIAMKANGSAV